MKRLHLNESVAEIALRVKSTVRTLLPDADVVLYGSRARGDAGLESDWDFLILTDEPVNVATEEKVRHAMYVLSLELTEIISAFVENRQEWMMPIAQASPYHQAIDREGIAV